MKLHEPTSKDFNGTPTWEFVVTCRCNNHIIIRVNAWNPPNEYRLEVLHHDKRHSFNSADLQIVDVINAMNSVMGVIGCSFPWDRETHVLLREVRL